MQKKKKIKKARMIFVSYIYERKCYNNPSMDSFEDLPNWYQQALRTKWGKKLHKELKNAK